MPVRVYRVVRKRFASTPLNGEGARLYGGRWNEPGTAMIYAAGSLALAELEALVHVDRADAPRDLIAVELEIPSSVRVEDLPLALLPRGWRRSPAPASLARLGTEWVRSLRSSVLRVPSAVVPREPNYLLNPAHRDLKRVAVVGAEPIAFDARLLDEPGRRATKRC